MDFVVTSRKSIAMYDCPKTHAIISIGSPGDEPGVEIPASEQCRGILRLFFHDAEDKEDDWGMKFLRMYKIEPVLFNESMASRIKDFFNEHKDVEVMIVHCEMGMCRSPAVAAALSKATAGDDGKFFQRYTPNMLVYRTLLSVLQVPLDQP